jgi:hypothetical protein
VRKEVTVRWNERILRIIADGEEVALHPRATGKGEYVTVRNHLPDYKVYSENERQVKYEAKMRAIGEDTHEYFRWLLSQKEDYWSEIVKGILGLHKTYGSEAVNKALKRARYYQVRDIITIKNILKHKLYTLEIEPKLLDATKTIFSREDNPLCRDLSYYTA